MVADELDYVVGVDTHLDEHVFAVVASPSGAVIAQRSVAANARGYASALRLVRELADGARVGAIDKIGRFAASWTASASVDLPALGEPFRSINCGSTVRTLVAGWRVRQVAFPNAAGRRRPLLWWLHPTLDSGRDEM